MELVVKNVSKKFKRKLAVNHVNLRLGNGVHALLGANGSGKTSLMRILCGVLTSDGDSKISLNGISLSEQRESYLSYIGYLPQHFGYYPNYTVQQFLYYMGVVKGLKKTYINKRIDELLIQLRLEEQRNKKMKNLSGGMLRRVGIAQALLNDPKLLILDEPTVGLDPKERINFKKLISSLGSEMIILLSTHIVSDIENIADDILVMKDGEILFHECEVDLLEKIKRCVWELEVDTKEVDKYLMSYTVVEAHKQQDTTRMRIVSKDMPSGLALSVEPTLEDFYLYYFEEEMTHDDFD